MKTLFPVYGENSIDMLKRSKGYYASPCDETGRPIGPIVGYAGDYPVDKNNPKGPRKQYVGFEYASFAAIERHGALRRHVAESLIEVITFVQFKDKGPLVECLSGFVGAPEGGKALADTLSTNTGTQYIFPDKVVTKVKSEFSREESSLVWGRHTPEPGESWILVEDVCNNFSTTGKMIRLIESCGAEVCAIACFLNRTTHPDFKRFFSMPDGRNIPILAHVTQEIPEYRQDDPAVAHFVEKGQVIWKPKENWSELELVMERARKALQ